MQKFQHDQPKEQTVQQGVQNTVSKLTFRMYKDVNRSSKKAAIPNLTSALSVNNTFCPLMSLCMTWF